MVWPNLPVLVCGSLIVALGWSLIRALSPQLGWVTLIGLGLVVVPVFAALLCGCEGLLVDERFGLAELLHGLKVAYLPAVKVTAAPMVTVLLTLVALKLWLLSGQTWMLVSVGLGGALSTVAVYTAVVALPLFVRTSPRLIEGWLVAFFIAARNPVPVLAVLSALSLGIWASAYLSFAMILLLPGPLALVWAAGVAAATARSRSQLA
ncbi:hypothetical protein GCM10009841_21830 [Microlunatus panaciterrae]|uniref:Uncharacterized protein n=1 Tax=Microlunatus panaciterrae TaxID=400768 RepID=A0ABS2RQG7_9ACTN|nr:hypothetical protein [Microlunatus panaciterrae]MBM7800737.1 hypothetical protein [Microlunatus panaciterrae]